MAKKKKDENEEAVETAETASVDAGAEEVAADASAEAETAETVAADSLEGDAEIAVEEPVAVAEEAVAAEEPAAKEAAPAEKPKRTKAAPKAKAAKTTSEAAEDDTKKRGKRAEKIGIVSSDKMMKTVTVRVDRIVKHPIYRKYVKKRKKFMAHDEMGSKIGDKVKIVETRPLSARKRWRVVEIIRRAES